MAGDPTDLLKGAPPSFSAKSTRAILGTACRAAELDPSGANLIRLGENALYRLDRQPVIVRIGRTMDYWDDAEREVAVAAWLAERGFSGARTATSTSQPIECDGHPVTFWEFIDGPIAAPEDVAVLGSLLRTLHHLTPPSNFRLPEVNLLNRVERRVAKAPVPADDKDFLLDRCSQLEQRISELSFQLPATAIHGDAHIGNVMIRDGRPVLIDFERFSWGNPEWDLAVTATEYRTAGWWSQRQYETFAEAYGYDVSSWDGFDTLRATHELKMTTWLMQNVQQSAQIRAEYASRMRTIRTGTASARWRPF